MVMYALIRAVGVAVLAAYTTADPRGFTVGEVLTRYDAIWYAGIADHGYDRSLVIGPDGVAALTNLAFFPLFPALIALIRELTSADVFTAELVVAWAAGLAAATGLYAVGAQLRGRRTGILLAALWAAVPSAVVESMGYAETLFTALAAWSLWAVLRRRWLLAGGLCLLAGLTRPTAAALVAAVGVAAIVAVVRRPADWRAWVGLGLAPLGLVGYLAWVALRLHRWDGYFFVQDQAWRMSFDGGVRTVRVLGRVITSEMPLPLVVTSAVVAAGVVLLIVGIGERLPYPLLIYAGLVLVLVIGAGDYYESKARLLLPAFPLLLPAAYGITRSRNPAVAPAVLLGLTVLSALYGVYLCLVWTSSP
jgi:hypothetical protein